MKRFVHRASFLDDVVAMLILNTFDDLGCGRGLVSGRCPFKTGRNAPVRWRGVTLQLANQKHLLFDGNRVQCLPGAGQAALSGFLSDSKA